MTAKQRQPEWTPPKRMTDAEKEMNDAADEADKKRRAYQKVLAEELAQSGLSQGRFAAHTPYTEQTIRNIAREYGVPPKRRPTVKSIND